MNFMEPTNVYTCKSCGYRSEWPISEREMADCHRVRCDHRKKLLRYAILIMASIALPILVRALVARL